jgi:nicotinate-nucleotide adenylyltransferase
VNAVFGGAFDPPHNGHVELARAALVQGGFERLFVEVVDNPGHKRTFASPEARLRLAAAAFEDLGRVTVEREPEPYTVDAVRTGRFGEATFLIGADEAVDFLAWKEPDEVVRSVVLGVANRSGYPPSDLAARYGDRVTSLVIDSPAVSSREIRELVARGRSLSGLVPPRVEELIAELGLYRGYTAAGDDEDLTTR